MPLVAPQAAERAHRRVHQEAEERYHLEAEAVVRQAEEVEEHYRAVEEHIPMCKRVSNETLKSIQTKVKRGQLVCHKGLARKTNEYERSIHTP